MAGRGFRDVCGRMSLKRYVEVKGGREMVILACVRSVTNKKTKSGAMMVD
jgi:hypothetical protein